MRLINTEKAAASITTARATTQHSRLSVQRSALSVVRAKAGGRAKMPREKAVAQAVMRTG